MALDPVGWAVAEIIKREASDADPEEPEPGQKELYASWSLFILITLLIVALFTSYMLQTRKIQAVHETVLSIFAGMIVGLILRLTAIEFVLSAVSFDQSFFFNLLLPPIILSSGYELHQGNFFRNIGTILTFAFAGTFISAVVLAIILWLWTRLPLDGFSISFVEAMSVGATLSATDPVTILAIFNTYKVDPQLYTVIFGESILNDAIAIVLFETAQKYREGATTVKEGSLSAFSLFESIGIFLLVFFGSLVIGLVIGVATAMLLKLTLVRRFPKIESCLIILIAYASYFFANAIHMSGIVSLLFCGICMKHYAYHNMSRRSQLTTKFVFQVMSQLSENFIFIYLGLSLFTERDLVYKPLFILITVVGICVARWCAIFPLSRAINSVIAYRARRRGREAPEALPKSHQMMLFWAGLRGAVGVALAAGLTGVNGSTLRATVLVVVVLTVIIFGGTTARMLEILGIRTGVVEEIDSDDEFDIEVVNGGTYRKGERHGSYSSGNANGSPPTTTTRPNGHGHGPGPLRRSSSRGNRSQEAEQNLLSPTSASSPSDSEDADLDLPPQVRRPPAPISPREPSPVPRQQEQETYPTHGEREGGHDHGRIANATAAIRGVFHGLSEDPGAAFRQIDEGFIKPHLLLDPGRGHGPGAV
ncbi:monovalent cation:H+ antiporter, CPA1 (nhx1) [Coniosporium tulheliwenetii]|uniref:Monovalent cation:H+ antiporter, CPA1 (Nhx1) n=1 Tax=Coniosporium tulheliwenetii TaxID=3383036 RepID=A0ACC2Z5Q5_9PEZI|nr:monovalent cation:H+ antiporter, CPA1 (nhx1) [Cladosporium sp. JES 115]